MQTNAQTVLLSASAPGLVVPGHTPAQTCLSNPHVLAGRRAALWRAQREEASARTIEDVAWLAIAASGLLGLTLCLAL